MASAPRPVRRGLVLGGGGVLGGAWAVGALAALKEVHGFEPNEADVIVGTSAGSVLAALLGAGATTADLVAQERGERVETGPIAGYSWDIGAVTGGARPSMPRLEPGPGRVRSGLNRLRRRGMPPTAFLSAFLPTGSKTLERIAHVVEGFTPIGEWSPHANLWIVTVDYESGERVVFGRPPAPVAPLSEAVQASCSIPAWYSPVEIWRRRSRGAGRGYRKRVKPRANK